LIIGPWCARALDDPRRRARCATRFGRRSDAIELSSEFRNDARRAATATAPDATLANMVVSCFFSRFGLARGDGGRGAF